MATLALTSKPPENPMNYDNLTREEATQRLREHDEAEWSDDRLWDEVIEPADVLYWLDACGDLGLAINCQGLPKELPLRVVEGINIYDVYNDWQGTYEKHECPVCSRSLYEFDFDAIYPVIDEWGDDHQYVEYLTDHASTYWDATGEHEMMCLHCRDPPNFSRMRPEPGAGEVRVFYGDRDEFSRFSYSNGVVRWDHEWDMDYAKSTGLWNHREEDGNLIHGYEIAGAFAKGRGSRDAMMERCGFKKLHVKELGVYRSGLRRFWRFAKEVLNGWATLDSKTMSEEPTHPGLNFTYFIEGEYTAWVPLEHYEKFKAELVWQSYRQAGDKEAAETYREGNDDLLSFGYYETPA